MEQHRDYIRSLSEPCHTVMDLSIAMALWFASRGEGLLDDGAYTSRARILLVGIGADEQLGGYGRHRTRFRHDGWGGLLSEMQLDVDRISNRNLGER